MRRTRAQNVEKALRMVWSSLESHLVYASKRQPCSRQEDGNPRFHQKVIREYAELLETITQLY